VTKTTVVKTIKQGDNDFMFCLDSMILWPRASFEITDLCPSYYKTIIAEAYNKGWLRPQAHIPVHEHFMEKLTK
jgi:hypothetical protein